MPVHREPLKVLPMKDSPHRHPFQVAYSDAGSLEVETAINNVRDRAAPEARRNGTLTNLLWRSSYFDLNEARRDKLIEEFLTDRSMYVQRTAICACTLHGAPNRVKAVLWTIAKSRTENQVYALRALAQIGDEGVFHECLALLRSGNEAERQGAGIALGFLKTTEARTALEDEFRRTTSRSQKFLLACGIVRCGGKIAVRFLEEYLAEAHRSEWMIAVCALAAAGSEAAINALESFLHEATAGELSVVQHTLVTFDVEGASAASWQESVLQTLKRGTE